MATGFLQVLNSIGNIHNKYKTRLSKYVRGPCTHDHDVRTRLSLRPERYSKRGVEGMTP